MTARITPISQGVDDVAAIVARIEAMLDQILVKLGGSV